MMSLAIVGQTYHYDAKVRAVSGKSLIVNAAHGVVFTAGIYRLQYKRLY